MSKANECDRCGSLYKPDYKIYGNKTHFIGCRPHMDEFLDLCPKCQIDLEKWFTYPSEIYAKVKEKENEQCI